MTPDEALRFVRGELKSSCFDMNVEMCYSTAANVLAKEVERSREKWARLRAWLLQSGDAYSLAAVGKMDALDAEEKP